MTSMHRKVIRIGFGLTGRVAPRLAGRLAFRLFRTTPSRKPATDKARQALANAQSTLARADRVTLPIGSGAVVAYAFAPFSGRTGETVLVIHGWGSRTAFMLPIIEGLRASGRTVIALDLPGHGESTGRTLDMASAVEAVDAVWRQFGPFNMIVGHSFGGAVAINAAVGSVSDMPQRKPKKLVTIAAPNALPPVFERFADWIGLPDRGREALFDEIHTLTGRPLTEFVGARQLSALQLPTLVIHAHDDKEVPVDNAYGLVGAGPHVEVFWADGYGHRRILAGRDVSQVLVDFADRPAPGPDDVAGRPFSEARRQVTQS